MITADAQQLEPGGRVTVYELDCSSFGADQLFFHQHLQSGVIWWQGQEYGAWPIEATGFERTGDQPPSPRLRVSNIDGRIGALCLMFDDLVGAMLIRRQTLVKYLDAANFEDGNPTADPSEYFPEERWFIERKVSEDFETVEFELTTAIDLNGEQLPGGQLLPICGWLIRGGYRGPYCTYNGPAVADINDQPTDDPSRDQCSGLVRGCKLRFGEHSELPHGGTPAAGLLRT